ncbi:MULTISPECIES: hypothetical protein [unclassified Streptomyces]|uniref:hypothetical protein n=1 Tax=unclassified Streptomyces TaxID=2593676 RepID=UPI00070FF8F9|nr:hypothetical protein [Streptomyces sp. Root1310]KQX82385.1 hypothetical protein ASD48_03570 [Streptomyces sp. Root1310]
MIVIALAGFLVLVLGGCACVWWAARGGPRWARAVAFVTLAAGELLRGAGRADRTSGNSGSDD